MKTLNMLTVICLTAINILFAGSKNEKAEVLFDWHTQNEMLLPYGVDIEKFDTLPNEKVTKGGEENFFFAGTHDFPGWMYEYSAGVSLQGCGRNGSPSVVVNVNTKNKHNLYLKYTIGLLKDNEGSNSVGLQYRIGNTGDYKNLDIQDIKSSELKEGRGIEVSNLKLPPELEDKENIQLRWIYFNLDPGKRCDRMSLGKIKLITG